MRIGCATASIAVSLPAAGSLQDPCKLRSAPQIPVNDRQWARGGRHVGLSPTLFCRAGISWKRSFRKGVDDESALRSRKRLAKLALGNADEADAGQSAEGPGSSASTRSMLGQRAVVLAREVERGCALVPPFRPTGRAGDNVVQDRQRQGRQAGTNQPRRLLHQLCRAVLARLQPQLPDSATAASPSSPFFGGLELSEQLIELPVLLPPPAPTGQGEAGGPRLRRGPRSAAGRLAIQARPRSDGAMGIFAISVGSRVPLPADCSKNRKPGAPEIQRRCHVMSSGEARLGGGKAASSASVVGVERHIERLHVGARTWSGLTALGMAITPGWRSARAIAIAAGSTPCLSAIVLRAGLRRIGP